MAIEVRPANESEIERWNDYVERSKHGTVFHRYEWLRTAEEHSSATLHTYIGLKGESVRGLFPFYSMRKGPFTIVFSPLPKTAVPFLGPILLLDPNVKRRRRDKSNKRFVDACLEQIDEEISPSYVSIKTAPGYDDVRPFTWQGFSESVSYTYRIDLTGGRDTVLGRFSGDARKSIRNTNDKSYEIVEGSADTIDLVYDHVTRRYDEQSRSYPLTLEYLHDVYDTLPDEYISTYEGRVGGEPVSGRISIHAPRSCYLWQGSPKPDADIDVPINDLLNWQSMQDAIDRDIPECDQVGANNYRISKYKSKFNPRLVPYHRVTNGTIAAKAALTGYQKFKSKR